jgi:hypothetical protein
MGPRRPPSPGEPACCGAARPAPGGSRVMARPGGASPWSSGRARYGACGPVVAGPCGTERPSPAGRRVSPGRVAGGRWSVGRTECCGPVLLGSRDPLSGTAGGGLDSHAWSWGPVTARFGDRIPLSGAPGPGAGAAGHGLLPGVGWAGTACLCCPPLFMRCEPGLPDRGSVFPAAAGPGPGSVPRTARCVPVRAAGRGPPGAGLLPGPGLLADPGPLPDPGPGLPMPGVAWSGRSVVPLRRQAASSAPRHAASSAPRSAPRHPASSAPRSPPRHVASSAPGTGCGRYPGASSPGISAGTGPSGDPAPARLRGGRPSCRSG